MSKLVSIVLGGAGLAMAACAPMPATQHAPVDDPVVRDVSGPVQCNLQDWQSYVGKPRQSLPAAPQGLRFRVLCKDCMATMDFRTDRVNFTYDDKDIITRVTCG